MSKYEDVDIATVFLSDNVNNLKFEVKRDGAGTSTLVESETNIIKTTSLDCLLNGDYSKFSKAKFLKIDTDGFDEIVLRGSVQYLTDVKPLIFMEYCPNALECQNSLGIEVFEYLNSFGYSNAIVYQNTGEYMLSFDLSNKDLIYDIRNFFYCNAKIPYADILIFNKEDNDLFEKIRKSEIKYFDDEKERLSLGYAGIPK